MNAQVRNYEENHEALMDLHLILVVLYVNAKVYYACMQQCSSCICI